MRVPSDSRLFVAPAGHLPARYPVSNLCLRCYKTKLYHLFRFAYGVLGKAPSRKRFTIDFSRKYP